MTSPAKTRGRRKRGRRAWADQLEQLRLRLQQLGSLDLGLVDK